MFILTFECTGVIYFFLATLSDTTVMVQQFDVQSPDSRLVFHLEAGSFQDFIVRFVVLRVFLTHCYSLKSISYSLFRCENKVRGSNSLADLLSNQLIGVLIDSAG